MRKNVLKAVANKICRQAPNTPEAKLMCAVFKQTVDDLFNDEQMGPALSHLSGEIPELLLCGIDSEWAKSILRKAGVEIGDMHLPAPAPEKAASREGRKIKVQDIKEALDRIGIADERSPISIYAVDGNGSFEVVFGATVIDMNRRGHDARYIGTFNRLRDKELVKNDIVEGQARVWLQGAIK